MIVEELSTIEKELRKHLYGHVVRLCSSTGKDDLSGISSNQVCHLLLRRKEAQSYGTFVKLFVLLEKKYLNFFIIIFF